MSYIRVIDEERAQGMLAETYEQIRQARGGVADVMKVQSLNPAAMRAHFALYKTLLFGPSELDRRTREMIGVLVSVGSNCSYGVSHHSAALRNLGVAEPVLARLSEGELPDESLSPALLALLEFAKGVGAGVTAAESTVQALRDLEWSDEAILDATLVAGYFAFLNRITLSLGISLENRYEETCAPELREG